jgi:phospholipid/cholesterol/gamma-HCH transport system substrate-binding protein
MKISNETKVGVLAAIAITMLVLGYNFMKGENLFSKSNTYYAVYDEVDQLNRSNPVLLNGYKIGSVTEVEMDYLTQRLYVTIKLPAKINIPSDSKLKITNTDLVGSKGIEVMLGESKDHAQDGDTLSSRKDAGIEKVISSVLTPITEKVNNVLSDLDTALDDVSVQETLLKLNDAIVSFKKTTDNLNELIAANNGAISSTIANLNEVSGTLKKSAPKVDEVLAALDQATQELNKIQLEEIGTELQNTITEIKTTLQAIKSEEGSLGKLVNDDELYNRLSEASLSIDSLAKDIQRYPRRYFGFTNRQKGKGDEAKEENEGITLPK